MNIQEDNYLLRKTTCMQMECSEDPIRIESIFSESNGFLHTYPPKLIATILKALRELKENHQLNAVEENAGPVPEIPLEYDQILKGGRRFWHDVNSGYLPEDLVLAARREEIDWVHSEGVYDIVPMQGCGHEIYGLDLGGHTQVSGSDTQEDSLEVVFKRIQNEEAR